MSTDEPKQLIADDDPLESQEFYELMQAYRHTSLATQSMVYSRFEEVKDFIRSHYERRRSETTTK